ncbi:fasciclin domain-containing protein [Qipengyuania gelatinilytica]|uniref:Fasciclin domain-containing protein n=1 Tax=Qipengyuania gelatinilytica TaxID=2867231 RepID=A0ABX9A166_9SPHN|nr:fasciclin domain-containing protein [Qipengyuania gelatinilytica]QZD94812.1 fasciclin domain-containing protein [Qipengyuania gelatinilytica]
MKTNFTKPFVLAGAIAGLAMLPACSSGETTDSVGETQDYTTRTLAAALGDLPEMASFSGAISSAQLNSIFDGPASYTVLAPSDEAFNALGEKGQSLMTEEQRPVLAGVLREHILPGHLTPEDITAAIESQGGGVTMTTFGGGDLTFSMDGETVVATNPSGEVARFNGAATQAANGVIIPVDAVMIPGDAG